MNGLLDRLLERPDISARTVLVTVFGDSLAPLDAEIWVSDLFAVMKPFGYSERLLRTSLSRLVADDWCESVRDGRRSRYRLTAAAREATAEAERRIYHRSPREWTGCWTLVLIDDADPVVEELRWNGFARLAPGLQALPHDPAERHRRTVERLGLTTRFPVAEARFDDAGVLGAEGRLTAGFGLLELVADYEGFIETFGPVADGTVEIPASEPASAFALRTLLVHEFRRLRMRDPDLPSDLVPEPWAGSDAFDVAAAAYARVSDAGWAWLARHLDTGPPAPFAGDRFTA